MKATIDSTDGAAGIATAATLCPLPDAAIGGLHMGTGEDERAPETFLDGILGWEGLEKGRRTIVLSLHCWLCSFVFTTDMKPGDSFA